MITYKDVHQTTNFLTNIKQLKIELPSYVKYAIQHSLVQDYDFHCRLEDVDKMNKIDDLLDRLDD